MGLGPEALALKQDPFSHEFIERSLGRMTEGIRGQQGMLDDLSRQADVRSGIAPSSKAARRRTANIARDISQQESIGREGFGQKMAEAKLQNIRELAGHETGLRGISRQSQAQERAASMQAGAMRAAAGMSAGASRYGTDMQGMLAKLGIQFDASKTLGTGQSMRGFAQPFDIKNTMTQTKQSPGIAGILGGLLGAGGSIVGMGGFGGMGKGLMGK